MTILELLKILVACVTFGVVLPAYYLDHRDDWRNR